MLSGGRFARQNTAFYSDLDAERDVIGLFNQGNDQTWRSLSQNYTVAYHRTAGPSLTILSTELRYSSDNNSSDNNLFGVLLQADTSTGSQLQPWERAASRDRVPAWNLQTDYTHPWGNGTKLETGINGTIWSTGDNTPSTYLRSLT